MLVYFYLFRIFTCTFSFFADLDIIRMYVHPVIHMFGGTGLGGKEKLIGWHLMV